MATSQATVDFLLDQLHGIADVSTRKMFGEYCLYLAGKPVAFICDDHLFVKPTDAARRLFPEVTLGLPYPKAKPHLLLTPDLWEDREWLARVLLTTASALPAPKPKPKPKPGQQRSM